jgi:hypothetical protein
MRRILLTLFVVGLLLILASGLQAQNRAYSFIELTDEDLAHIDLHDGSVNDWLDVLGEPTLTLFDFDVIDRGDRVVPDPANLDFRFYVALERADDVYANSFDRSVWSDFDRSLMQILDVYQALSVNSIASSNRPTLRHDPPKLPRAWLLKRR